LKAGKNPHGFLLVLGLLFVLTAQALMSGGCSSSDKSGEVVEVQAQKPVLEDALVFVRDSDIWIINPDGTGEARITASPEPKAYPRLSPDGRYVVFTSYLGGEDNPAGASVKRVSLGGSDAERTVTTLTRGFAPAYLPDGRIAFVRTASRQAGSTTYTWDDIFLMNAEGGGENRMTDYASINDSGDGLRILYLSPSPDGNRIAFVRGRRSDARWVSIVSLSGGNTDYLGAPPLESNPSGRGLADGSIALDAQGRIFLSHASLNRETAQAGRHIYLLDPRGGNETLLSSGSDDFNPTLSPNGFNIAYETAGRIVMAESTGFRPQNLTSGAMPSWGRSIRLSSSAGAGGSRIAFVRNGNIWLSEPDHGGERRLTAESEPPAGAQPGSYAYVDWGGLSFSPDSSKLAAWKVGSDIAPSLIVINVADSAQADLGQEYKGAWETAGMYPWPGNIAWSADNVIYCTAGSTQGTLEEIHVVRLDLSASVLTDVEAWARNPALSPDGRTLSYISAPPEYRGDEIGWDEYTYGDLVLLNLESGRKVTVSSQVVEAVFTPGGDRLVAVFRSEPDTELVLMDLEGNILTRLDTVGPSFVMGHPSVSPGGSQAIFHTGERLRFGVPATATLMMVDLGGGSFTAQEWGKGCYPAWH
jgi:Tol biopolymer transport system component